MHDSNIIPGTFAQLDFNHLMAEGGTPDEIDDYRRHASRLAAAGLSDTDAKSIAYLIASLNMDGVECKDTATSIARFILNPEAEAQRQGFIMLSKECLQEQIDGIAGEIEQLEQRCSQMKEQFEAEIEQCFSYQAYSLDGGFPATRH